MASRFGLDPALGLAADLIEEEIAADPVLRGRRRQRPDGVIVDYSGDGILVAYRLTDDGVVELLELLDLTGA